MKTALRTVLALAAACTMALTATHPANAQIVSKSEVAGVAAAIVGVGAAIGVGIYFAVHANHSASGCTVAAASGLQLQSDQQTWSLVGSIAGIKPGERVRVSGKKQKQSGGAPRPFLVEKLAKDYGACSPRAANP